jgi:toxin FitB
MILVDTNAVSELTRKQPNPGVARWFERTDLSTLYLSSHSVAEIDLGIALLPPGRRRTDLSSLYDAILNGFEGRILPFDLAAARAYVVLEVAARGSGKPLPRPDGYIAAVAQANGLAVATRDEMPFRAAGLEVINPWTE